MTDQQAQDRTFKVLAGLGILAAAWEIWTIVSPNIGDTFSATIRKLADDQPFIPFMSGFTCRHLFQGKSLSAFIAGFAVGDPYWPLIDGQEIKEKIHEL